MSEQWLSLLCLMLPRSLSSSMSSSMSSSIKALRETHGETASGQLYMFCLIGLCTVRSVVTMPLHVTLSGTTRM